MATETKTRNRTTILSAPMAWGKTRNAEAFRREFKCTSVVDDWGPLSLKSARRAKLTPGALHLTNLPPAALAEALRHIEGGGDVIVVSRGWDGLKKT